MLRAWGHRGRRPADTCIWPGQDMEGESLTRLPTPNTLVAAWSFFDKP